MAAPAAERCSQQSDVNATNTYVFQLHCHAPAHDMNAATADAEIGRMVYCMPHTNAAPISCRRKVGYANAGIATCELLRKVVGLQQVGRHDWLRNRVRTGGCGDWHSLIPRFWHSMGVVSRLQRPNNSLSSAAFASFWVMARIRNRLVHVALMRGE